MRQYEGVNIFQYEGSVWSGIFILYAGRPELAVFNAFLVWRGLAVLEPWSVNPVTGRAQWWGCLVKTPSRAGDWIASEACVVG